MHYPTYQLILQTLINLGREDLAQEVHTLIRATGLLKRDDGPETPRSPADPAASAPTQ